jgi:hypothetical protein
MPDPSFEAFFDLTRPQQPTMKIWLPVLKIFLLLFLYQGIL